MATYERYPRGYPFFTNQVDDEGLFPLSGGKLFYYEAGTTDEADTYSDPDGLVPNENPIILNSSGRLEDPVYLGSAQDYKERLEDADGNLILPWPQDDIPAAPTEAETTDTATARFVWSTKTANETLTGGALVGKALKADPTAGAFTLTLPSAVAVGNGVGGLIAKSVTSANDVTVNTQGAQTINGASSYVLSAKDHTAYFLSDGANWRVALELMSDGSLPASRLKSTFISALSELKIIDRNADFWLFWDASANGFVKVAPKFIDKREPDALHSLIVADKDLATPPGSPSEGDRYIVAAGATGAWSAQDGKIASYFDSAWAFYAPVEGWFTWVSDEDLLYRYTGSAWVAEAISHTELGIVTPFGGRLKLKAIEQTTTLSGASTDASTAIPIGIVLAVSCRVTTAITGAGGATSFSVGDGATVDKFGGILPFTLGTTNRGHIGPTGYYSGTDPLRYTPNAGTFTGGVVRSVIWYLEFTPPTS